MSERKYSQDRIINSTHRRANCICPFCEQDKVARVLAVWIGPSKNLVCYYGVCDDCATSIEKMPKRWQTLMCDRANDWLVSRYPELLKKLPPNFGLGNAP